MKLHFYRWFVGDAWADEHFKTMTLEERGLYRDCLDFAWVNDGLPTDPARLCRLVGVSAQDLIRLWPAISSCWVEIEGRLRNPRQEKERQYARELSERNSIRGKLGGRPKKPQLSSGLDCGLAGEKRRASGSGSLEESTNTGKTSTRERAALPPVKGMPTDGKRWAEFQARYPFLGDVDRAYQTYISIVTEEDEPALFADLERYLASKVVADGFAKEAWKWLDEQKRGNWGGTWPPREAKTGAERLQDAQSRKTEESIKRWRDRAARALETPKKSILGE